MARIATHWAVWYAGLIDGPEPPGRATAAEIAASRAEADRNFAEACFEARQRWQAQHPEPKEPVYDSVRARMDRLARFES